MKTTMLIVEILVGGVLVSLALGALSASLFYDDIQKILSEIGIDLFQPLPASALLLLSTIFVAIAYTVGVLSEPIAREIFERLLLNRVKEEYVEKYLKDLDKYNVDTTNDPILRKLRDNFLKKKEKDQVRFPTGLMRFYILMKNPELYQNTASQLHRFRLMRMLFLAESICIVAIIIKLYRESSSSLLWVLGILIFIAFINVVVIHDRFKRYCRDVGRSYMVLLFDQNPDMAETAPQTCLE